MRCKHDDNRVRSNELCPYLDLMSDDNALSLSYGLEHSLLENQLIDQEIELILAINTNSRILFSIR